MAAKVRTGEPRRRRTRPESGAVAVEFALVLPLLVVLVLGITTSGLSYTHAIGVTNAVREGARFGATADASSSSWLADVRARVRATQFDDTTSDTTSTTAVCVQLVRQGSPNVAVKESCVSAAGPSLTMPALTAFPAVPAGLPPESCVVRVIAAREFQINIAVVPVWTGTLVRGSVARYERGAC